MPHADDAVPGYFRVCVFRFLRYLAGSLAADLNQIGQGEAQHLVGIGLGAGPAAGKGKRFAAWSHVWLR
jgi:hypothetical protein